MIEREEKIDFATGGWALVDTTSVVVGSWPTAIIIYRRRRRRVIGWGVQDGVYRMGLN